MIMLFGSPRVVVENVDVHFKRRKSMALLAYLVIAQETRSRDYLANLFWPSLPERGAAQNLRNVLADIRATPAGDFLYYEGNDIGVDEAAPSDVARFSVVARRLEGHPDSAYELPEAFVAELEKAFELYGRGFLAGFRIGDSQEFDDWQYLHAQRYQQAATGILAALARHYVGRRMTEGARRTLDAWLKIDGLAEEAHRLSMQLHSQNGEVDQALHVYQALVRVLRRQEGAEPEAETRALYERIRSGKSTRPLPDTAVKRFVSSILPAEPIHFVGREADLDALKQRLGVANAEERRSPLVLQGALGVGKSALAARLVYDAEVRAAFPDGILWTTLGPWPDHDATLRLWTSVLEVQELRDVRSVEHRAMHLTAALYDRRVLLVVDDVWSLYDARLLALAKRGSAVLITTHFPALAYQIASSPEDISLLAPLSEQAALALLTRRAPALVASNKEAARQLVRFYDGVPLVLNVLAQTFNQNALTYSRPDRLPLLADPARLLDQPIASEQVLSREPQTLRRLIELLWQHVPESVRDQVVDLINRSQKPYRLDIAALERRVDCLDIVESLENNSLLIHTGDRVRLNPFLVALILSDVLTRTTASSGA